jgi:hypothetical protein
VTRQAHPALAPGAVCPEPTPASAIDPDVDVLVPVAVPVVLVVPLLLVSPLLVLVLTLVPVLVLTVVLVLTPVLLPLVPLPEPLELPASPIPVAYTLFAQIPPHVSLASPLHATLQLLDVPCEP